MAKTQQKTTGRKAASTKHERLCALIRGRGGCCGELREFSGRLMKTDKDFKPGEEFNCQTRRIVRAAVGRTAANRRGIGAFGGRFCVMRKRMADGRIAKTKMYLPFMRCPVI